MPFLLKSCLKLRRKKSKKKTIIKTFRDTTSHVTNTEILKECELSSSACNNTEREELHESSDTGNEDLMYQPTSGKGLPNDEHTSPSLNIPNNSASPLSCNDDKPLETTILSNLSVIKAEDIKDVPNCEKPIGKGEVNLSTVDNSIKEDYDSGKSAAEIENQLSSTKIDDLPDDILKLRASKAHEILSKVTVNCNVFEIIEKLNNIETLDIADIDNDDHGSKIFSDKEEFEKLIDENSENKESSQIEDAYDDGNGSETFSDKGEVEKVIDENSKNEESSQISEYESENSANITLSPKTDISLEKFKLETTEENEQMELEEKVNFDARNICDMTDVIIDISEDEKKIHSASETADINDLKKTTKYDSNMCDDLQRQKYSITSENINVEASETKSEDGFFSENDTMLLLSEKCCNICEKSKVLEEMSSTSDDIITFQSKEDLNECSSLNLGEKIKECSNKERVSLDIIPIGDTDKYIESSVDVKEPDQSDSDEIKDVCTARDRSDAESVFNNDIDTNYKESTDSESECISDASADSFRKNSSSTYEGIEQNFENDSLNTKERNELLFNGDGNVNLLCSDCDNELLLKMNENQEKDYLSGNSMQDKNNPIEKCNNPKVINVSNALPRKMKSDNCIFEKYCTVFGKNSEDVSTCPFYYQQDLMTNNIALKTDIVTNFEDKDDSSLNIAEYNQPEYYKDQADITCSTSQTGKQLTNTEWDESPIFDQENTMLQNANSCNLGRLCATSPHAFYNGYSNNENTNFFAHEDIFHPNYTRNGVNFFDENRQVCLHENTEKERSGREILKHDFHSETPDERDMGNFEDRIEYQKNSNTVSVGVGAFGDNEKIVLSDTELHHVSFDRETRCISCSQNDHISKNETTLKNLLNSALLEPTSNRLTYDDMGNDDTDDSDSSIKKMNEDELEKFTSRKLRRNVSNYLIPEMNHVDGFLNKYPISSQSDSSDVSDGGDAGDIINAKENGSFIRSPWADYIRLDRRRSQEFESHNISLRDTQEQQENNNLENKSLLRKNITPRAHIRNKCKIHIIQNTPKQKMHISGVTPDHQNLGEILTVKDGHFRLLKKDESEEPSLILKLSADHAKNKRLETYKNNLQAFSRNAKIIDEVANNLKRRNILEMNICRIKFIEKFNSIRNRLLSEMKPNLRNIPIKKVENFQLKLHKFSNISVHECEYVPTYSNALNVDEKYYNLKDGLYFLPSKVHKPRDTERDSSKPIETNNYEMFSSESDTEVFSRTSGKTTPDRERILSVSRTIRSPKHPFRKNKKFICNNTFRRQKPAVIKHSKVNLVAYLTRDEKNGYKLKRGYRMCSASMKNCKIVTSDVKGYVSQDSCRHRICHSLANRDTTPDHLKSKFDDAFKRYASRGRPNGELISYKRSTEWLRDAGVIGAELTTEEANDTFKCVAGVKIALNRGDYRHYLKKLTRLKKLKYTEVFERMCIVPNKYSD